MEQGIYLTPYVMDVATHLIGGLDDAMEMVPSGPDGVIVLEHLVPAVPDALPATRAMLDAEYAARAPAALGPQLRAARAAVEDVEAPEPWCEGAGRAACVRLALDRALRVQQAAPRQCDGYALRARTRVAGGEVAAGLADLQQAADVVADRVTCLEQLATVARRAGDEARAEVTLESVVNAGCADAVECARNLRWVGSEEEGSGHPRKALAMFKRAYERTPDDDALLEHIAVLAAAAGLHAEAAEDYDRLARKHPAPAWTEAAKREHDAAMRAAIRL
jgi:tetratricopeptide (TPR) repeat protein